MPAIWGLAALILALLAWATLLQCPHPFAHLLALKPEKQATELVRHYPAQAKRLHGPSASTNVHRNAIRRPELLVHDLALLPQRQVSPSLPQEGNGAHNGLLLCVLYVVLGVGWFWQPSRHLRFKANRPKVIALASWSGAPSGPDIHKPGDVVNGYEVIKKVGSGFSSTTYEARGPNGDKVALKVISLRGMGSWKPLDLFEREVKVLKALNHPSVPQYIDSFDVSTERDMSYYLVQRLAEGETIAQLSARGVRLTESKIYDIGLQLLDILIYLGDLRPPVVHRDIKPENVVIDLSSPESVKVALVDFGGVVDAAKSSGFQSTVVGTYGYMAPEQYLGKATTRSDIFAVGATLLFLLSGQAPSQFPQSRMRIVFRDQVSVSDALAAVLERMLEPVEEDRFSDAKEAREALQASRDGVPLSQRQEKAVRRSKPSDTEVLLISSEDQLDISLPCGEMMRGDLLSTAAFTVVWTSIVAFWTRSALLAGAPLLFAAFSLPFWATSFRLIRETAALAQGEKVNATLDVSFLPDVFVLRYVLAGQVIREIGGKTQGISKVKVASRPTPEGDVSRAVFIKEQGNEYWLGEGLTEEELQWIAEELRTFLKL